MGTLYRFARFRDAVGGNVALVAALCAFPLMLAAGGAMEYGSVVSERSILQDAVDAGALAGASRMTVAGGSGIANNASDVATETAQHVLTEGHVPSAVTFNVASDASSLTLTAVSNHRALTGLLGDTSITVKATAETLASVPLCVLQTGTGDIDLRAQSRIRATGCAVHADSDINVDTGAMIQADRTQAVGTVNGPVSPAGDSGAVAIDDPFAAMNLDPPTACDGKPKAIKQEKGTTVILPPGVHCEEYDIDQDATLILEPGEHYFMDDLKASNNAVIRGDDVALIFGSTKKINFADKASVELGARRSGPFAGFLIVTTRDNHEDFTIASDNVSKLLGTIYIPSAELDVDTAGNVAQDSAWSIIVASAIRLDHNPVLVINSGYVGSGVPVPAGVGPGRTAPVLSR